MRFTTSGRDGLADDTSRAGKPTYLVVADKLAEQVARWPSGTRVPSEPELSAAEGISRLTARAAVQELERRQLVRRRRGAGTFVSKMVDYNITANLVPSWSASVRSQGATPLIRTESINPVPATPEVAAALGARPGSRVLLVSRLRYVDGELAACADSYLPEDLVTGLAAHLAPDGSLFDVLDKHYGLTPVRGWTKLGLQAAPDTIAQRLQLRGKPPLIVLESRTDSQTVHRPIDLTHSWLRPEVFRVTVEMGAPTPVVRDG
ncbi:GntR family transcriptional regulator [Mycobacterium interjectum]|uniref:GntR family transcriptional regulator n=1 Tax=Mycobacterium interjectum TaxID=33895 RepID=UPI0008354ABD|nr:GntR family transcriptional regulator [Mycobacterium interjectum]MCV7089062.1 GntR family transcriptional regulator [Mycobacterium interjectum]